MQIAKEEVRRRIVDAARAEFLEKGFGDASIRPIAARAGTSKSNVYNYYRDKDDLFRAVVEPVLSAVDAGLTAVSAQNSSRSLGTYSLESQGAYIRSVMGFVFAHAEEVKLLLFQAGGSSLAGYHDAVAERFADVLVDWSTQVAPGRVSRFFVKCVAGFYLDTIGQMLAVGVSPEEAASHFREFLSFVYGGWSTVLHNCRTTLPDKEEP